MISKLGGMVFQIYNHITLLTHITVVFISQPMYKQHSNPGEFKANPQCKTTASDEGEGTRNSNTHHYGEKPPTNFTQLYQIAIPTNNTQTARNKKRRQKAPSSNHKHNGFPSIEYPIYTYAPKKEKKITTIQYFNETRIHIPCLFVIFSR